MSIIFRQICKISPIAMGLYISVCVCVYVYVCVSVCVTIVSENQKCKKKTCRFWHSPSNCIIPENVLCDLDLLFEGQRFESRPFDNGKRPYRGNECEYCYSSHNGERPCKCDECEYCCTQHSFLARHKLSHSSKSHTSVTNVGTAVLRGAA